MLPHDAENGGRETSNFDVKERSSQNRSRNWKNMMIEIEEKGFEVADTVMGASWTMSSEEEK